MCITLLNSKNSWHLVALNNCDNDEDYYNDDDGDNEFKAATRRRKLKLK